VVTAGNNIPDGKGNIGQVALNFINKHFSFHQTFHSLLLLVLVNSDL
jgi:hypothetical protein